MLNTVRLSFCRYLGSAALAAVPTTSRMSVKLPAAVLPTDDFVEKLRTELFRDKLAMLLSEMEIVFSLYTEVPRAMDSNQWFRYFNLVDLHERKDFLRHIYHDEQNEMREKQILWESRVEREKISVGQQQDLNEGKMVYARGFHEHLHLMGNDFRKAIDKMYGSRLLRAKNIDEEFPEILVDCRFLHEFSDNHQSSLTRQIQFAHDQNWFNRNPFNMNIINLMPDDRLSRFIKKHWLFLTGPSRIKENMSEDLAVEYDEKYFEEFNNQTNYTPHPFIPRISARGVDPKNRDETIYISPKSSQFLDEKALAQCKHIVVCASKDPQPWCSSLSAARADMIKPYCLPVQKYVTWAGKRAEPLHTTMNILRDFLLTKDWKYSCTKNLIIKPKTTAITLEDQRDGKKCEYDPVYQAKYKQLLALSAAIKDLNKRRIESFGTIKVEQQEPQKEKRARQHRYSREERNMKRNGYKKIDTSYC